MKPSRRKTKRSSATAGKRPQPHGRKSRKRFITRTEARRRAERHVLKRLFRGATVRDGAEVRLGIYFPSDRNAKDVWVVYKNPVGAVLKSSEVVVVCKRTGRVLCEGPAGDEG